MSGELIEFNDEPSVNGNPSTTIRGLFPAVKVPMPLIIICGLAPGCAEGVLTTTPGEIPESCDPKLAELKDINLSASTVEMDPVTFFFTCVPYPTTTTSSNCFTSGCMEMLKLDWFPTVASCAA